MANSSPLWGPDLVCVDRVCMAGGGASNWYLPGGYSYHEGDDADARMTAAGEAAAKGQHANQTQIASGPARHSS
jgi:hypothetical protein